MQEKDDNRRSFLKQILAGSAIVAGSTLVGTKAKAKEQMKARRPDEVLYRKSEAFKKYYDSLR
ncbi:MAG: Tat pathway signal protein [Proteobacteria bacterium]|nr:Tat pathway signal protein [Pseudomonadota bacterium]MBU1420751.1 Tat pathway signal protein [Pseudomonadota bacterium]MBU1456396.1 Tat pathway signal protein [Pseudomonadota bacterium]